LSAVTQAGSFSSTLRFGCGGHTGNVSRHARGFFPQTWSAAWIMLKVSAFLAFGVTGGCCCVRGGRADLVGFGMLYAWCFFWWNSSTARFQEPWCSTGAISGLLESCSRFAALLSAVAASSALAASALAVPVLFYQAHDPLDDVFQLAAALGGRGCELPAAPVPWGSRTLYMLGREYAL